jgi:hypothetical protein
MIHVELTWTIAHANNKRANQDVSRDESHNMCVATMPMRTLMPYVYSLSTTSAAYGNELLPTMNTRHTPS